MTIYSGIPFLLFDSKYQFASDDVKGILKDLKTSADSVYMDSLGQVKFSWFIKHSPYNLKTDFVRIEAKGGDIVGKSMDMIGTKPSVAYIPSGDYSLTYYTGDRYGPANGKTRIDFSAKPQSTAVVQIPIYMPEKYSDVDTKKDDTSAADPKETKPYLELTPLQ
jgi:hypothetical protein